MMECSSFNHTSREWNAIRLYSSLSGVVHLFGYNCDKYSEEVEMLVGQLADLKERMRSIKHNNTLDLRKQTEVEIGEAVKRHATVHSIDAETI